MTKNIDINIKFASAFGMGMIALVGIILIQNFFAGVLPICCTDSHAWGGWVSDRSRIHVTNSDKVMFLLNEIWIYALVFYTLSVMLRMCMRCYQGAYFTPKTYKLLERGGLLIMLSMVGYVVAKNVNMYLFASTIDGVAFDQEYFNPLNLLVLYSICSGCAFWGLGKILNLATVIKDENETIV